MTPPEPVEPPLEAEPRPPSTGIVAGFWRRFFADLIDTFSLGAFGYALGYAFKNTFSDMGRQALWVGLACSLLYFGVLHTGFTAGQTLGKRLLGIQVLKRDGSFLSLPRAWVRYLVVSFFYVNGLWGLLAALLPEDASRVVGSMFFLIVLWAFFACFLLIPLHPLKRGLHDLVAGSVVVYQGRYDRAALDALEDPARAARALWVLSGATVLVAALVAIRLIPPQNQNLDELSKLSTTLRTHHDIRGVQQSSFNNGQPSLFVEVFLPLRRYEDPQERERVREEVYQEVRDNAPDLGKYQEVHVVTVSGFHLGIASMNLRDPGPAFH